MYIFILYIFLYCISFFIVIFMLFLLVSRFTSRRWRCCVATNVRGAVSSALSKAAARGLGPLCSCEQKHILRLYASFVRTPIDLCPRLKTLSTCSQNVLILLF